MQNALESAVPDSRAFLVLSFNDIRTLHYFSQKVYLLRMAILAISTKYSDYKALILLAGNDILIG